MRAFAVAVVLLSTAVFAQEIGTEIEPVGPKKPADITVPPPPPDDPYATNPMEPVTPKPKELPPPAPPEKKSNNKKKADSNMGPGASAGFGSIGVRGSFGGGAFSPTGAAPTVGMSFFATDQVAITADVGFGLALVRGNMALGWSAAVGILFELMSPAEQLRPVVAASFGLGMPVSANFSTFTLMGQVGGGAEYFFSQHFSVSALMMIGVPMDLSNGFDVSLYTFSPGVGATLYF